MTEGSWLEARRKRKITRAARVLSVIDAFIRLAQERRSVISAARSFTWRRRVR